jgi:hypothetical protein
MSHDMPKIELATTELLKPPHQSFVEHFAVRYKQDPMLFAFHSASIALLVINEIESSHIQLSTDEAISALKLAIGRLNQSGSLAPRA